MSCAFRDPNIPCEMWQKDSVLEGKCEGMMSSVASARFSVLSGSSRRGTVWLWRVSDGTLLRTLKRHTDEVRSVVFSPAPLEGGTSGTILASGSNDGTVRLWGVAEC